MLSLSPTHGVRGLTMGYLQRKRKLVLIMQKQERDPWGNLSPRREQLQGGCWAWLERSWGNEDGGSEEGAFSLLSWGSS